MYRPEVNLRSYLLCVLETRSFTGTWDLSTRLGLADQRVLLSQL